MITSIAITKTKTNETNSSKPADGLPPLFSFPFPVAYSRVTYLLDLNKTEDGLLSIRLPAIEQEELHIFPW